MNLSRLALICIFIAVSMPSIAEQKSEWIRIWNERPRESKFEINFKSFDIFDNASKTVTLSILSRTTTKNGKISFLKIMLTDQDCYNGYGSLIEESLDGTWNGKAEFVIGGENGNSLIAETICSLADIAVRKH